MGGVGVVVIEGVDAAGVADGAGAALAIKLPRPRPRRDLEADMLFGDGNEERLPHLDARGVGDFVSVHDIGHPGTVFLRDG